MCLLLGCLPDGWQAGATTTALHEVHTVEATHAFIHNIQTLRGDGEGGGDYEDSQRRFSDWSPYILPFAMNNLCNKIMIRSFICLWKCLNMIIITAPHNIHMYVHSHINMLYMFHFNIRKKMIPKTKDLNARRVLLAGQTRNPSIHPYMLVRSPSSSIRPDKRNRLCCYLKIWVVFLNTYNFFIFSLIF